MYAHTLAGARDSLRSTWRRCCRRALETGEIDDARRMPAGGDKAQEVGGRHRGRAIVDQRVVVERVVLEHGGIEHRGHPMSDVVDERKRRDTPGAHPEERVEILRTTKRETRRPEPA